MFSESDVCLTKDFVRALHLLHSSEPNSADDLLALLNASITERYGSGKTILRPTCTNFHCESKLRYEDEDLNSKITLFKNIVDSKMYRSNEKLDEGIFIDSIGNKIDGNDEIPRISIPDDEITDDSLTCKVCNVPEFGPLILIKCRKCGELYHPLCHQPAVVDAQPTDFDWRCNECRFITREEDIGTFKIYRSKRDNKVKQYKRKVNKQGKNLGKK